MLFLRQTWAKGKTSGGRLRKIISKRYCSNNSGSNLSSTKMPSAMLRSDYRSPHFLVPQMHLEFDLDPERTIVRSRLHISRAHKATNSDLVLNGVDVELKSIKLISSGSKYDKQLSPKTADYVLKPGTLTIPANRLPSQKAFVVRSAMQCSWMQRCDATGVEVDG